MLPHGHLVRTLPAQTRLSVASIDRAQRHDGDLDRTIQAAHLDGYRPCSLRPSSPPAADDARPPAMSICSARRDSVRCHVFAARPRNAAATSPKPPQYASRSPFSTSVMSVTTWHVHSEPRRRPTPCALKTSYSYSAPNACYSARTVLDDKHVFRPVLKPTQLLPIFGPPTSFWRRCRGRGK
ncbi:hypothetical protein ACLOJK_007308 [Asimina triloba]